MVIETKSRVAIPAKSDAEIFGANVTFAEMPSPSVTPPSEAMEPLDEDDTIVDRTEDEKIISLEIESSPTPVQSHTPTTSSGLDATEKPSQNVTDKLADDFTRMQVTQILSTMGPSDARKDYIQNKSSQTEGEGKQGSDSYQQKTFDDGQQLNYTSTRADEAVGPVMEYLDEKPFLNRSLEPTEGQGTPLKNADDLRNQQGDTLKNQTEVKEIEPEMAETPVNLATKSPFDSSSSVTRSQVEHLTSANVYTDEDIGLKYETKQNRVSDLTGVKLEATHAGAPEFEMEESVKEAKESRHDDEPETTAPTFQEDKPTLARIKAEDVGDTKVTNCVAKFS